VFESFDRDKTTRFAQPVYVNNTAMGYHNKLNAFRHPKASKGWSLSRLQRFPCLIWLDTEEYFIEFTGSNPMKLHFTLETTD